VACFVTFYRFGKASAVVWAPVWDQTTHFV